MRTRGVIGLWFLALCGLGHASEADWKEQIREASLLLHNGHFEDAATMLQIVTSEADDPRARAAAFTDLGFAHARLGRFLEAERNLRSALRLARDSGANVAVALNNLAVLYIDLHRYGKARSALKEASVETQRGKWSEDLAASILNNLGEVERAEWNLEEAEACYRESLGILERNGGPAHRSTPTVLLNLGVLSLDRGDAAEATRHIGQALEIWRAEFGEEHPNMANGLMHLARATAADGRPGEAVAMFRQALRMAERCLGAEHPKVAEILWAYADVLRKMKQKREAKKLRKRAEAIRAWHEKENLLNHTVDWSELQAWRER